MSNKKIAILGSQLVGVFGQLGKRIASIPLEPDYTTAKTRLFDNVQSAVVGVIDDARRFDRVRANDRIEP